MGQVPNPVQGRIPLGVGVVSTVGMLIKLVKHDGNTYRAISVPKSAIPPPLWPVKEVVMIVGVPQLGVTLVVEARRWAEKKSVIYYTVKRPYSEYFTELARQGIREIVLYQVLPKGGGRV